MPEVKEGEPSGSPPMILVADDDPMIRDVLQTKLKKSGFSVSVAADGRETLAAIADRLPDLLILDIKMPSVDGLEICRRLRDDEVSRALPILMLTAYGGIDHIMAGLTAGADDYVTKPFHIEELLLRIRSLLRARQLERELRDKETRLVRIETLGQLLVTLAHHINNSLTILSGRAQVLDARNPEQAQKLKEACLMQVRRIEAVLKSLQSMANQMKLSTASYVGMDNAMIDIEEEITRRLAEMGED